MGVTIDRDQIRRDAEQWANVPGLQLADMASHCLALLAELEQAEQRAADLELVGEQHQRLLRRDQIIRDLESRLAKVPALVEALKEYADEQTWTETTPPESVNTAGYLSFEYEGTYEIPWQLATEALAAWENE